MSKFKPVVQLHNHSVYSLLDAVPTPKEWVGWCLESGTPGLAVTDHGTAISMFDALRAPKFIEDYNKENKTNYPLDAVSLIPGVELYVKLNAEDRGHYHITAWAASTEGYFNLMKLASLAYNDTVDYYGSIKARVTYEQIKQYKKGIKFGTGCIVGPIGQAIMRDKDEALAEQRFLMYRELFGDDLYIEFHVGDVTHNFNKVTGGFDPFPLEGDGESCTCDQNKQRGYNRFLMKMVQKYGGKCVPVTDAHFIKPEDKIIQDCVLKNGNENGWYFYESYHQIKVEEMFSKLQKHLGTEWLTEERFKEWVDNTYEVLEAAKTIDVKHEYHLPAIFIPEDIKAKTEDYDKQTYLLMLKKIEEHRRWINEPAYVARFKKELDVIAKNGTLNFLPYFLLYEDICTFARSKGFLQNIARGSAGGSLLSYYLKIIHVDPIKADLPFERFLSKARINAGSFPDIDADFGDKARPEIMRYLKDKYGAGFAQICTFNKIKVKNAIKDAMWAIHGRNRNDPEVEAVCRLIPDSPQGVDERDFLYGYTDQEGNYNVGLLENNEGLILFFKNNPEVHKMVDRLIGMIRGLSRHASAFVISTLNLPHTRVPTLVMKDKFIGDIPVTQFNADMIEKCGLVKADILGVKTLTAVTECVELIKKRSGVDLLEEDEHGVQKLYRLPEDKGVYLDFYNKKTDSAFQFNTSLIKGLVQEFYPTERKHLAAFTALARPGALDAPLHDTTAAQYYMDVRNNKRSIEYLHKDLEPILKDSNGAFIYQEEVMKFLVDIAGYSWEQADIIRSAIAKKKHEVIMATFTKIRESCKNRGWSEEAIETICKQIQAFSRYSFNKSHSYAYAELGYITMWLKHHYPLEWWTSTLNLHLDDEDKMRKDVEFLGDLIKPPSINNPSVRFAILATNIVAPMSAIKNVGPKAVIELCAKAPFANIKDFVERIDHRQVHMGAFSSLICARAVDELMDKSVPYAQARLNLMDEYKILRKKKLKTFQGKFDESMADTSPLNIFLLERELNKAFNKNLVDDKSIVKQIQVKWPRLRETHKKTIPFLMHDVPVIRNIDYASKLLDKLDGEETEVAMILLYSSSNLKTIISKKNGKSYTFLKIEVSDGYNEMICTNWNVKVPLRWGKNSIVYIKGKLKRGWRDAPEISIDEMELL